MILDAHHHLWRYTAAEFEWIGEEMASIRRDFLVPDLEKAIGNAGVDGTIVVQARQTVEETRWLLELAGKSSCIRGVVGWAPLKDPGAQSIVELLAGNPLLRGLRHVVQGEADGYMLRDDFNRGVSALRALGLVYDILIVARQLPEAVEFVDRHPEQVFVLDHIAKPDIRGGRMEPWRNQLTELARRQNVYCKLSGMVTEADWKMWMPDGLKPYADVALEAFGPRRLMFGSDWPVCLVACEYKQWVETVRSWVAPLSEEERAWIFGKAACEAYGISREGWK